MKSALRQYCINRRFQATMAQIICIKKRINVHLHETVDQSLFIVTVVASDRVKYLFEKEIYLIYISQVSAART